MNSGHSQGGDRDILHVILQRATPESEIVGEGC